MHREKPSSRHSNSQESVYPLIEEGVGFANRALELCTRLPELRIGSPTSINLGTLGSDSVKVKQDIKRELEILKNTFDRLHLRARLPLVVGVIGRFSGGKSSLLNAFFNKLFPDRLPAGLTRTAENTATDTTLTYITHNALASQLQHTSDIEIRHFDHEVLRTINFIDTPGTGWKAFNKKEVVDLLSSADILLFVSKPYDLLDDDSVEMLNQKFSAFKETPMWYVVTFASAYSRSDDDNDGPNEEKFRGDLTEAKRKLKAKSCDSAAKLSARDCVVENVEFKPGENTFLVDSISGFGTQSLLDKIITTFDNSEARVTKHRVLGMELEITYGSLLRTLDQTAEHISAINKTLTLAYRRSIQPEIEKYIATGLVAEATEISHSLFSCIGEARMSTDQYFRSEQQLHAISYPTESAEVTILESELEELKDRKRSYSYAYRAFSILFDVTLLRSRMESVKLTAVDTVSQVLDEQWSKRSKSGSLNSSSINNLVRETVDQEVGRIERAVAEKAERNQSSLEDYLRVPAQRLRNRYNSADTRGTIFARQYGLLNAMGRDIPSGCDELYKKLDAVCETTQTVRSSLRSKSTAVIDSRIPTFASAAAGVLHDYVYVPTQEALMLVLGDEELIEARLPGKDETQKELINVGSTLTKLIQRDDSELEQALTQVTKNSQRELLSARNQWNSEWSDLKGQFGILSSSANEVAVGLDENMRQLANLLESERTEGLHKIRLKLREAATEIGNVVRQKSDQINLSITAARSKAAAKFVLEVAGLVLTLVASGLGLWKARPTSSGSGSSLAPLLIIAAMGVAIAGYIVKQLKNRREQEEHSVYSEFKKSVEGLRQAVRDAASGKMEEMCAEVERSNTGLAERLDLLYVATIDSCEGGNYRIIPNLMSQVEKAAHLALQTQKNIAMIAGAGIARATQRLSNGVEKTAREVSEKMRNQAASIIRDSGERCAEVIRAQVQAHRNIAEDLQQLIANVRKANTQEHPRVV